VSRILIVHWKPEEAAPLVRALERSGHEVAVHGDRDSASYRVIERDPPDAFVIDLGRLPSHGRAVGTWLRQRKATRRVPLVFVEGEPDKTRPAREQLPDAIFTSARRIRGAVTRALRRAPAEPVVPDTMAGYAGTPLPRKLGVAAGSRLALLGAPAGFDRVLGPLPDGVQVRWQARGENEVVLLFARTRRDLSRRWPAATEAVAPRGRLWICWPKRASGQAVDLGANEVRAHGLGDGWVDFKIAAVDPTWSGLCFTRRRDRR
jgi:CheY-like chemotaxis protein